LGRHTGILHFTPQCVMQYEWAHKEYKPWGYTLPLQCPQCGILNPWSLAYLNDGYAVECKNEDCRDVGGRTGHRYSLRVTRPAGSVLLNAGKDSGWLRTVKL
jgi:hypothetical protein